MGHRGLDRVPEVLLLGEENRSLWAEQGPKKEVLASWGARRPLTALTGPVPLQRSFFGSKMFLAEILAPLEKLENSESPLESVWSLLKRLSTPLGSRILGCCAVCRVLQQTSPRGQPSFPS